MQGFPVQRARLAPTIGRRGPAGQGRAASLRQLALGSCSTRGPIIAEPRGDLQAQAGQRASDRRLGAAEVRLTRLGAGARIGPRPTDVLPPGHHPHSFDRDEATTVRNSLGCAVLYGGVWTMAAAALGVGVSDEARSSGRCGGVRRPAPNARARRSGTRAAAHQHRAGAGVCRRCTGIGHDHRHGPHARGTDLGLLGGQRRQAERLLHARHQRRRRPARGRSRGW